MLRFLAPLLAALAATLLCFAPALFVNQSAEAGTVATTPGFSAGGRALATASWSSGTQVPALIAASTISMLTVGSAADNLVQRDGSGKLTGDGSLLTNIVGVWPLDSWTYRWTTATGSPTSDGWEQAGTQSMTIASTTQGGIACYSLTPSGSSGTSLLKKAVGAATGDWELRMRVWVPARATTGTATRVSITYNPDTTASGSKRFEFGFSSDNKFVAWNGSANVAIATVGAFSGRWIDLTLRVFQNDNGLSNSVMQLWIGRVKVYEAAPPTLGATSPAAGDLAIGRSDTGSWTDPIYIADVAISVTGVNSAPPDYTFRAEGFPL